MNGACGSHPCSPASFGLSIWIPHRSSLLGGHGDMVLFYSYILDAERPEAQGLSKAGGKAWAWVSWRRHFDGDGDFSAASKEHLGSAYSWPSYVIQPGGLQSRTGVPRVREDTWARPCAETVRSARRTRWEGPSHLQTSMRRAPASSNTGCFSGGICLSLGRLFITSTDT